MEDIIYKDRYSQVFLLFCKEWNILSKNLVQLGSKLGES